MKGKNVTLDEGTKFNTEVSADIDLNLSLEDLPKISRNNNDRYKIYTFVDGSFWVK